MAQTATIRQAIELEGVGLHSGVAVKARLLPAPAGTGIVFLRTDRAAVIPARTESVTRTSFSTTLGVAGIEVATVEHLLSACFGLGITDLHIELDGPEVPILDGSALPFVELIEHVGVRPLGGALSVMVLKDVVRVEEGGRWVELRPAAELSIDYRVRFDAPAVGSQRFVAERIVERFRASIAPARTFGFLCEVPELRRRGLGHGGSLDNCVVVDGARVLSGQLRFRDEFVRHKVLDLLGALALLEHPLRAHVVASRAGEGLHVAALRALLARPDAWELAPSSASSTPTVQPYRWEHELFAGMAG
jgi:UDP-3-O-[3-hydroxymyristoyl] N-acetylglucosamine deacetylase